MVSHAGSCPLPQQPLRTATHTTELADWPEEGAPLPFAAAACSTLEGFAGVLPFPSSFPGVARSPQENLTVFMEQQRLGSGHYFCDPFFRPVTRSSRQITLSFSLLTLVAYIPGAQAWHMLMNVGFI